MIKLEKDTVIDTKINELIQVAWHFGQACSDDGITKFDEAGDSHIEFLRNILEKAKDQLYTLMLNEKN